MFKLTYKKLCKTDLALFFFIIHRFLTRFLIPEILSWGPTERLEKNWIITVIVQSFWGAESLILAIYYSNDFIAQVSHIKLKDFQTVITARIKIQESFSKELKS